MGQFSFVADHPCYVKRR